MSGTHDEMDAVTETPKELREMSAALDRLGARDRSSARHDYESQLFEASRGALAGSAPLKLVRPVSAVSRPWMRLAAAVALVAGAGLIASVWLAPRGGGGGVSAPVQQMTQSGGVDSIRADLEEFLSVIEAGDSWSVAGAEQEQSRFWSDDLSISEESM